MCHVTKRLSERNINIPYKILATLAYACRTDTALIIAHLDNPQGDTVSNYHDRVESNGDLVVLICRNHKPYTIFFRRSTQTNTAAQLKVNRLEDISDYLRSYIQ